MCDIMISCKTYGDTNNSSMIKCKWLMLSKSIKYKNTKYLEKCYEFLMSWDAFNIEILGSMWMTECLQKWPYILAVSSLEEMLQEKLDMINCHFLKNF